VCVPESLKEVMDPSIGTCSSLQLSYSPTNLEDTFYCTDVEVDNCNTTKVGEKSLIAFDNTFSFKISLSTQFSKKLRCQVQRARNISTVSEINNKYNPIKNDPITSQLPDVMTTFQPKLDMEIFSSVYFKNR
jgi:hypothetical protein